MLIAHMTEHLILMFVPHPLLMLNAPQVPSIVGIAARSFIRDGLAYWINLKQVHLLLRLFTHPMFGWIGMNLAFIAWHAPASYASTPGRKINAARGQPLRHRVRSHLPLRKHRGLILADVFLA
jgi:cytochrome c oxidase assembly factor CtaG